MGIRTLAAAAGLALTALCASTAAAAADPADPPSPPPPPSQSGKAAPGGNAGRPGIPLPPGLGYTSPPGHRTVLEAVVPRSAPPPPPPPQWAPWLPVAWNSELSAWGVWWNGVFLRL